MIIYQEKLIQLLLLGKQNSVAHSCLNNIFEGNAQFKRTDYSPFSTKKILRDYRIRHEINEELTKAEEFTEGYADLIAGLEKLTDDTLNIDTVVALNKDYWVLTNNDSTKLIGVLKIPRKANIPEQVF